jgi:hypothetical protein
MHPGRHRAGADVEALAAVASALLPAAEDLRYLAGNVMHHAPDAGAPPAPDAVLAVQSAAVDALTALARGLEESSHLLAAAARRYEAAEAEVAKLLGRSGSP